MRRRATARRLAVRRRARVRPRHVAAARRQGGLRRLGQGNTSEDPIYLERRFDRYKEVLSFGDLYTPAEKRAFLLTPRQEFTRPEDKDQAYVSHYIDIGFGVTITPPGTMGRMTSTLQFATARRCSRSAPAPATSRRC